jgi:hypothetical protein
MQVAVIRGTYGGLEQDQPHPNSRSYTAPISALNYPAVLVVRESDGGDSHFHCLFRRMLFVFCTVSLRHTTGILLCPA